MALTALETKVLAALKKNADEVAGGDFGILKGAGAVNYKKLGLTGQAFGGVLTSLQEKGLVEVHEPVELDGGSRFRRSVTQFTLPEPRVECPHVNPYDAGESAQPPTGYKPFKV